MINLGNIEIADLRLGASQVQAAYLGIVKVWPEEQPFEYLTYVEILSERNYVNSPALPLDIVPTDTMVIQIDWTPEQYTGNSMFGCPYPDDNRDFRLFIFTSQHAAYDRGSSRLDSTVLIQKDVRCTIELGNYYIKNLTTGTQQIGSASSYTSPTSPLGFYGMCKIYGCKIYDNDVLIRDLKPALANGNPCLHDEVTGTNYFASPGVYLAYEGYTPDPLLNGMLLHFDGINNVGKGDSKHSADTNAWENTANSTTRKYLARTSASADTDWSSNGATFSGDAGQEFYLVDNGQRVEQLSSIGLVGSFTYTLGFVYDPDTMLHNCGYIGEYDNSKAFIALSCTSNSIRPVFKGVTNFWNPSGNLLTANDVSQYLSAGQFNTVMFGWKQNESNTNGYFYVFVNGAKVQETNTYNNYYYSAPQTHMLIGASTLGNVCKGTICDIRLYDRILDTSEANTLNNVLVQRYASSN